MSYSIAFPAGVWEFGGKRLAVSENNAIEALLSDVPFFSVGITAFMALTLLVATKRMTRLSLYVYASALLAFIAAIFDLTQTLARGRRRVANNRGLSSVSGFIIAREISLSLHIGFRYLFFWAFIAQLPRGETRPPSPTGPVRLMHSPGHVHSASWKRWGMVGLLFKWVLLLLTLLIPVLQLVWRIVTNLNDNQTVYGVESFMQILASTLLFVKLALNVAVCPQPVRKTLKYYAGPLFALSVSLAMGIANSACIAFSETTAGRFLQAIALYVLLLFVLIGTYLDTGSPSTSVANLSPGPPKASSQPTESVPPVVLVVDNKGRPIRPTIPSRVSTASRLSAWMIRAAVRPQSQEAVDQRRLWDQSEVEKGNSPIEATCPYMPGARGSVNSREAPAALADGISADKGRDSEDRASLPNSRPTTGFSISSYYATGAAAAPTARATDSPIYGLGGIRALPRPFRALGPEAQPRSEVSTVASFDEILRQQIELDNSIAALRLLSPAAAAGTADAPFKLKYTPSNFLDVRQDSSSTTAGSLSGSPPGNVVRHMSTARSDFSLSVFPDPPQQITRAAAGPSNLHATLEQPKPGLHGTQYNITSFIGDLTKPDPMLLSPVQEFARTRPPQVHTSIARSNSSASSSPRREKMGLQSLAGGPGAHAKSLNHKASSASIPTTSISSPMPRSPDSYVGNNAFEMPRSPPTTS